MTAPLPRRILLALALSACHPGGVKFVDGANIVDPADPGDGDPVLTFSEGIGHEVAALIYDRRSLTCRQRGDIAKAFEIIYALYLRESEENQRRRWGDREYEKMRDANRAWQAEEYRKLYVDGDTPQRCAK